MGKISQAAIVAGAAYRNEETFKQQTGITNARLIKDKLHHDTKVSRSSGRAQETRRPCSTDPQGLAACCVQRWV